MADTTGRPLPLRKIALMAAAGTLVCVMLTMADYVNTKADLGGLVAQKPEPLSQQLMLPEDELDGPAGAYNGGHDGRYFYAIARDFPDLRASAPYLDRPAYRDQRILFPALAKVLHPWGIGPSLIWTMFAIGVAGVLLAGFATGCLSSMFGGKTWAAFIPPVWYGSWVSLRITVPDPLALGFALSSVALALKGRHRWALAAGLAAAFTRDTSVIILIGYALWKRDRRAAMLAAIPAGSLLAWSIALRLMKLPMPSGEDIVEFTVPFKGIWQAAFTPFTDGLGSMWAHEPLGAYTLLPALAMGILAMVLRGWRHPMFWMLVGTVSLVFVVGINVVGPERNASRMALPIVACALVALLTPDAATRAAALDRSGGSGGSFRSRTRQNAPLDG